jgi:pyridoxine/pyridoxamine 5'-phosphate oxidase
MINVVSYKGNVYVARHGGPFDRGSADSYYGRPRNPHYYTGATMQSTRLEEVDMSDAEVAEYHAGYDDNEEFGSKKEY